MKKLILLACFVLIFTYQVFSQNNSSDDSWKNKWLYTSAWAGYGSGFSMGLGADVQLLKFFAVGLELGLVDKNHPALSVLPKFTFRPWKMEIDLYGGLGFGYSRVYDFIWGVQYGIDLGYKLGPGVLFAKLDNGLGWSVGLGYRMGFFNKK